MQERTLCAVRASENGEHGFGWAAKGSFAVGQHDGAFDEDRVGYHRVNELLSTKLRVVEAQVLVSGFVLAHQLPWLHSQFAQDTFQLCGTRRLLLVVDDRGLESALFQQREGSAGLATARIVQDFDAHDVRFCVSVTYYSNQTAKLVELRRFFLLKELGNMNKLLLGTVVLLGALGAAKPAVAQSHRGDNRPVMAVAEFKNDTSAGWWGGGVGRELSTMLTNELSATGQFRMVDRQKLGNVLQEQDLATSGRVKKGSGPRTGELTGAQYLVQGTVTSYDERASSTGGGISFKGVSLGGKHKEAYLAIDLQVIDTETGEVAYTRTVEGRSSSSGVNVGLYRGGFGGALGHEDNTPAGKAIRAALVEATDYLACVMVERGSCLNEYNAKERKRRDSNRGAIKLD